MNLKNVYFKITIYFLKWVSLLVNIIYIWCAFLVAYIQFLIWNLKGEEILAPCPLLHNRLSLQNWLNQYVNWKENTSVSVYVPNVFYQWA